MEEVTLESAIARVARRSRDDRRADRRSMVVLLGEVGEVWAVESSGCSLQRISGCVEASERLMFIPTQYVCYLAGIRKFMSIHVHVDSSESVHVD